jgi:hypothetical protein
MKALLLILVFTLYCSATPPEVVYSQIVDGGGWKTTLIFSNPTNAEQCMPNLSLLGGLQNIPLTMNGQPFQRLPEGLKAFQTLLLQSTGASSPLMQGALDVNRNVTVTTSANTTESCFSVLIVNALLTYTDASGHISEAFVQPTPTQDDFPTVSPNITRVGAWFDHRNGFATGVALQSFNGTSTNLTFNFFDGDTGNLIATQQGPIKLSPFGHLTFALSDVFPETAGHQGIMDIFSDNNASGSSLILRFNPTGGFAQEY